MTPLLSEQETHLNLVADDRNTWYCYCDDPVMQARLERAGATLVSVTKGGGKNYTLRSDQIVIRTGKRKMSEAQKVESSARLAQYRSAPDGARG